MNRDDVIKMAREAGMEVHERKGEVRIGSAILTGADSTEQVERFAQLVAAQAAAEEREACADVADDYGHVAHVAQSIAAAIRARGTA